MQLLLAFALVVNLFSQYCSSISPAKGVDLLGSSFSSFNNNEEENRIQRAKQFGDGQLWSCYLDEDTGVFQVVVGDFSALLDHEDYLLFNPNCL